MQFHRLPEGLFRNGTAVRLLRALVLFPAKEYTGRELAAEARVAPAGAIRELHRLHRHGLLESRVAGRSQFWRWRRRHVLTRHLQEFFRAEGKVRDRLDEVIARGLSQTPGLRRVVLFGSVARGEEAPDSDIDLLVMVARPRDKEGAARALDALRVRVAEEFGNRLAPLVYDQREAAAPSARRVVAEAERTGRLILERPR